MAAVAGANAPVSAVTLPALQVNELLEYEKILKLRDEVFAGSHPRLTVPTNVVRKVSPRTVLAPTQRPPTVPSSTVMPSFKLPGLQLNSSADAAQSTLPLPNGKPAAPLPEPPTSSVSGIDPIFLTKTDVVLRAEVQLHRQRIERKLQEIVQRKRTDARHKSTLEEVKPDFDVSDVFVKALDVAKPIAFDDQRIGDENASASDSFDENSFYSSKAPDSTPRERHPTPLTKHQGQPINMDELDADDALDQRTDEVRHNDMIESPYKINQRPPFNGNSHSHPFQRADEHRFASRNEASDMTAMHLDDDDDEPEYSPPEPIEQFPSRGSGYTTAKRSYEDQNRRPNGRYSGQYQGSRRQETPPESDMRIVRNHITSPLAPQPSRVSPLAIAKAPPMSQNRRPQYFQSQQRHMVGQDSLRTSPDAPAQSIQPNKKRKLNGKKAARKRAAASPDVAIKDEPVSPPPFHEVQPLGAPKSRPAQQKPVYIDLDPPREVRYVPATESRAQAPQRQVTYDMDPPMPHSEPRLYSRLGVREVARDDQDLRRVASLQHMRPPQSRDGPEPVFHTPTRLSRAPSRAPIESVSRSGPIRTYEEPIYTYERPLVREERAQPSPAYRDVDVQERYQPQTMAPPQRRIVVDQHGNQFYETIHAPRTSVVSQNTRPLEIDSYNDAALMRNGSIRAASVLRDPYREERYVQEMPPPQMSYRRVTDTPRHANLESRQPTEIQFDPRQIQRSASVQVVDYPSRQPIYIDNRPAPRETVRMSSVRPTVSRYEEPAEHVQGAKGVRPEGREMSVYVDDRPQVRREYVPVEQPAYRRVVQEDGYYEVDDGGRMVMDGPADGRHYVTQRY